MTVSPTLKKALEEASLTTKLEVFLFIVLERARDRDLPKETRMDMYRTGMTAHKYACMLDAVEMLAEANDDLEVPLEKLTEKFHDFAAEKLQKYSRRLDLIYETAFKEDKKSQSEA